MSKRFPGSQEWYVLLNGRVSSRCAVVACNVDVSQVAWVVGTIFEHDAVTHSHCPRGGSYWALKSFRSKNKARVSLGRSGCTNAMFSKVLSQ